MKRLTITRKIAYGFTALVLISGLLGGFAVSSMRLVQSAARTLATEFVPEVDVSRNLERDLDAVQLAIRSYGFTAERSYLEEARKGLKLAHRDIDDAQKLAEAHPNLVKLRADIGKIQESFKAYERAIDATEARNLALATKRKALDTAATGFITNIDLLIESQKARLQKEINQGEEPNPLNQRVRKLVLAQEIRGLGNAARISAFKAQALRDNAIFSESLKNFEPMDARFTELFGLLKVQSDIDELNRVKKEAYAYRECVSGVMEDSVALSEIGKQRLEAATIVLGLADDMASTGMKRTVEAADSSNARLAISSSAILVGAGVALVTGVVIAFAIIRGTSRVLTRVADGLNETSEHVSTAANQVASASQSLAEGSSEQAAGLEETSASLEEMASMTKRNADGAQQAKEISNLTRRSADVGAEHMQEMRQAMAAIKASSDEIAKIVKTIDEIAFQTNVLALNAAVEAARAGDAGMGFAVVADEVRSLAQRSAQSARETTAKIEDAIRKSEHGVVISAKVAEALTDIVEKARRVDTLVAEIATASSEQSQGISQVNTALSQMDKITQSNAAGAEEGAAAAEELSAQAIAMQKSVVELRSLISDRVIVAEKPKASAAPSHSKNLRRPALATPKLAHKSAPREAMLQF